MYRRRKELPSETQLDKLTYHYHGNQLMKVVDNGNKTQGFTDSINTEGDYTYDAVGNMTSDANKGISVIRYNHLNLPTNIVKTGADSLVYRYLADGTRRQQQV